MNRAIVVAATLLSAATTAGCQSQSTRDSSTALAHPGIDDAHSSGRAYAGDTVAGRLVFNTNCATCHGTDGRAGGVGPPLIDENERQNLEARSCGSRTRIHRCPRCTPHRSQSKTWRT